MTRHADQRPTHQPYASTTAEGGDEAILYSRDAARIEPRRVIPSGHVSPDGSRTHPNPSMTSKVLVLGGMGLAAAAATAAAVLAVRAVVDGVSGSDDDDARKPAPKAPGRVVVRRRKQAPVSMMRFAETGNDVGTQRAEDRARMPSLRPSRPAQQSVVGGINDTVSSVTHGIKDVLATVTAAVEGFRAVAAQTGGIVDEFRGAAEQVKSFLEPTGAAPEMPRNTHARTAREDIVDLRDRPQDADARTHRL